MRIRFRKTALIEAEGAAVDSMYMTCGATSNWTPVSILNLDVRSGMFKRQKGIFFKDILKVCAFPSELCSLGFNIDPAINCHPGISHAG